MKKKTIRMICYGPIAVGPQYNSSWEDVWIEYFVGKRKKVKEGPCIVGTYELDSQIKFEAEFREKHLEWKDKYLNDLLRARKELSQGNKFA